MVDDTLAKVYMCAARYYQMKGNNQEALRRGFERVHVLEDSVGRESIPYQNAEDHVYLMR